MYKDYEEYMKNVLGYIIPNNNSTNTYLPQYNLNMEDNIYKKQELQNKFNYISRPPHLQKLSNKPFFNNYLQF